MCPETGSAGFPDEETALIAEAAHYDEECASPLAASYLEGARARLEQVRASAGRVHAAGGGPAEGLAGLVLDMLEAMPPSREALAFATRAGQLGVTDREGNLLVAACMPGGASRG
jgi:hypothetical protein